MTKSNYFRIGAFILLGIGLFSAAVIYLGAGTIFKKVIPIETYFEESVQGLSVGGQVKFRGVQIGTVSEIAFVSARYGDQDDRSGYVLVTMELEATLLDRFFGGNKLQDPHRSMRRAAERGLRVRHTTQGLTGVAYLEFDFMDSESNPPLLISWEPKLPYCPSAPSTFSRLGKAFDNIGSTLEDFREVDIAELADTVGEILDKLNAALGEANVATVGELVVQNLTELRTGLRRVNTLLHEPKAERIIPDAADAVAGVKRIVLASEEDVVASMASIRALSASLERTSATLEELLASPELQQSLVALPGTLDDIAGVAQELRGSMVQLERMLRQINELTRNESDTIRALLDDTGQLIKNMNALAGEVRENPSGLLFGAPPQPSEPEKGSE